MHVRLWVPAVRGDDADGRTRRLVSSASRGLRRCPWPAARRRSRPSPIATGWWKRQRPRRRRRPRGHRPRSEEHTSELQSQSNLVCRLLLEKKKKNLAKINSGKNKKTEQ